MTIRHTATVLALALAAASAPATATQWQGGTGTNWSTGANWVGGVVPPKSNAGTVEFTNPATANTSSHVDQAWTLNGLDFFNNNWTLTGEPIMFIAGGGAGVRLLTNHSISISNSLVFNRAVPVEVASGAALTLPAVSGTGSLSKTSPGALTINSLDLQGTVTVTAGSLTASPVSPTSAVIVNGTLNTTNGRWAALSGGGTVNVTGSVSFNQSSDTIFTGTIAGNMLQKEGPGILTLAGNNTWTGGTVILFGSTLRFGNFGTGTFPDFGFVDNLGTLVMNTPGVANIGGLNGPFNGTGHLVVESGAVNQAGAPWTYAGNTTVNGGSLTTTNLTTAGSVTVNVPATWTIGGSATIGSLAGYGNTTLQGNLTFGTNNADTTYGGFMMQGPGPASLTKVGTGTFTVAGPIIAGMTFNVEQGTLRLQGPNIAPTIVVKAGATLAGLGGSNGSIQVNAGAFLVPQVLSANFIYGSGTVRMAINGTTLGSQYSSMNAQAFEADGLTLQLTGSYVPVLGNTFMLVDNQGAGAVTATFVGLPEGAVTTFNGMPLRITYVGGTGNDVVLSVATQAVTPSKIGNGTISPDIAQTVIHGQTRAFTLTPAANHHVASVGGTCPAGSLVGSTYTTGAITANCTVVASFAIDTYSVTPSAGSNGTISPTGVQTVAHGGTQAFTVTPATGYNAAIGGTCPVGTLNGTGYTTGAITAACTVVATFTLKQYTVTPSAGANGTISPTGAQTVGHGSTQQFTVTPATGYTAVVGGTCPVGALVGTTYTTAAITGDCTVAATFTLNTYTVTPSAGANGTISPGAAQTVGHGGMTVFTVTPNAGYSAVVGGTCGGSVAGTTYTTNAITANCTVAASFSQDAAPALSLSVPSLAFGSQSMGTTSPPMPVTVTNTGNATLTVASVASDNARFAQTNNCTSVAPAATCTINVTFSPVAVAGALNSTSPVTGTVSITSNAAGSPHAVSLTGTGQKSLVTHYYRSILGRAPDAGGANFWASEAARVAALGANVNEVWFALSAAFYFSPEYVALNRTPTQFVTDLYRTFFNREPDSGGLNFWVGQMASGMPREIVLVSYMFSTEFGNFTSAIFGNTAARAEMDTVGDFYRGLLARLPDDGGFNFWVGKFRTAQCVTPVSGRAAAITAEVEAISSAYVLSQEYTNRARTNAQYVGDLYNAFLRRGGDLGGVQFWIGQVDSGAQTREQVRVQFRNSAEFQARVQAIIAQGCL